MLLLSCRLLKAFWFHISPFQETAIFMLFSALTAEILNPDTSPLLSQQNELGKHLFFLAWKKVSMPKEKGQDDDNKVILK